MIDTSKFEKLEKEELENVAGGCGGGGEPEREKRGFYPGMSCPDCGGTLLETDAPITDGHYHTTVCPNCDQNYYWSYLDEYPD